MWDFIERLAAMLAGVVGYFLFTEAFREKRIFDRILLSIVYVLTIASLLAFLSYTRTVFGDGMP